MIYLKSFELPDDLIERDEGYGELGVFNVRFADVTSEYPWFLFENRKPSDNTFLFSDITIFYGGNGSGKSTLLNLIGQKLQIPRKNMFNSSPVFETYLDLCEYKLSESNPLLRGQSMSPIRRGRAISSDDVFFDIIQQRENEIGYENGRTDLVNYHFNLKFDKNYRAKINFETGEGLKKHIDLTEARRKSGTRRDFIRRRIDQITTRSNGENAFDFFINSIEPSTLTLLDEPENSLSAKWQRELAIVLRGLASAEKCQLIISTHSPFLLAIPGAKIYNLDAETITENNWYELENVRYMYELFRENERYF